MKSITFALISALMFLSQNSFAKENKIEKRVNKQAERVGNGIVNKKLTNGEIHKIQKKQEKIHGMIQDAVSDGKLTQKEVQKIQNQQIKASKQIYSLKHNENGKFRAKQEQKRYDNLERRLGKGVLDGSLTSEEAAQIRADMQKIEELRKSARENGKLSPEEMKTLRDLEKAVSQKIHAERHDNEGTQKASKPAN